MFLKGNRLVIVCQVFLRDMQIGVNFHQLLSATPWKACKQHFKISHPPPPEKMIPSTQEEKTPKADPFFSVHYQY